MKSREQSRIPTSKVSRASKFVGAGLKVGGNYLKYYTKRALGGDVERRELDEANAEDIYESLSELKGSALKAAQMLSMDFGLLPEPFADKFQLAQYKAKALSFPLVVKTFKKDFGKHPMDIYDEISRQAVHAASIGQVHKARLKGDDLAVKIQYPGVANSVSSDLKIAKPLAAKLMNVSIKEIATYAEEVEKKLIEETDYTLELKRSIQVSEACSHIKGLTFAKYYPDLSSKHILTMDWVEGIHIRDWLSTNPSQKKRNQIGQLLWDFYLYQIHKLRTVHADPHPGNFLITGDENLGVLDFGCVKEIPLDFYNSYFKLQDKELMQNEKAREEIFYELEILLPEDSSDELNLFTEVFTRVISLLGMPFYDDTFDFGNDAFFNEVYATMESLIFDPKIRRSRTARGSKHAIYINRTFFGLYTLLHELRSEINTASEWFTGEA